jgi:predicted RNA-binding Zn ribbon-like protein
VLFALFAAAARGEATPAGPLAAFNARLGRALARSRLVPARQGLQWGLSQEHSLDAMLPAILRAAADLLLGAPAGALRECASERCRWLFVDASPSRRRRWCDMAVCGNRAKVGRHYARRRGTGAMRRGISGGSGTR